MPMEQNNRKYEVLKAMSRSIETSSKRINLEAIMKYNDKYQQKADAWGRGDFKALIKRKDES